MTTTHHRPYHYEAKTKDGSEHLVIQREDDGAARFVITRMSDNESGTQMHIRVPGWQFESMIRALQSIAADT